MGAYRYLFTQLVQRELRRKYKGSTLGVLWYMINPLVLLGAYTLMFGTVFKVQAHPDYPIFLMVGLMVWTFFQQSLLASAESLIDQGALVRKAAFPRAAIPASTVVVQLVMFCTMLALVLPLALALRGSFGVGLLLVPVLIATLFCFVLGCALVVSVMHAYFRDVAPTVAAALLPLFFLTPIFFQPDSTLAFVARHPWLGTVLGWVNPVAPFIGALRSVLYNSPATPDWGRVLYSVLVGGVVLGLGMAVFRRMERDLAVVV